MTLHSFTGGVLKYFYLDVSYVAGRALVEFVRGLVQDVLRQEVISTASSSASARRHREEFICDEQLIGIYLFFHYASAVTPKQQEINQSQNSNHVALAYLLRKQWMNYTNNRTLHIQSGKIDITIKTVYNPQYFQNLLFDYKINNSNIKKFYDRTESYIILFTLVRPPPSVVGGRCGSGREPAGRVGCYTRGLGLGRRATAGNLLLLLK